MFDITIIEGEAKALDDRLENLLDWHAMEAGHPFIYDHVNLQATNRDGEVVGGLIGKAQLGWLFVRLLALAPEARRSGLGGKLLARAEAVAGEMGLCGVYLDTYEFQAPGFYSRLGYSEIGRLPAAGGHPQRIWFAKTLGGEAGS